MRTIYDRLREYLSPSIPHLEDILHDHPSRWPLEIREPCWIWQGPLSRRTRDTKYRPSMNKKMGGFVHEYPQPVLTYHKKQIRSLPLYLTRMSQPDTVRTKRKCLNTLCVNPAHYTASK